jgi:phospholipase/carboxylesterase
MIEARVMLGELEAIGVGDPAAELAVVVLHGRDMAAADLAPFAHSLAAPAYLVFPDAPARAWWPVDSEDPPGRAEARARLAGLVAQLARRYVLVGFSQGGMLAMDFVLHGGHRPEALVLLSSSRIALEDWTAHGAALTDLPVLVAHGRADAELPFAAGEQLRDFVEAHGARTQWIAFDGGHVIPLVVWRAVRKLIARL